MKHIIVSALALSLFSADLYGSSHREAPEISRDPEADITDVYVFPSKESSDNVAFIMNVSPAYQAYAGPNWYRFGDDVLYEMHIDTTGDAIEDVTYQFRFKTDDYRAKEGLIVANFPAITYSGGKYSGSLSQTYSITKVSGDRRKGKRKTIATGLPVAPPRIGPHTTDGGADNVGDLTAQYQAYRQLSEKAIKSLNGSKFFAGPRNDPFFVDLGAIFDQVSPRLDGSQRDALRGSNVLSIAFELPKSEFLAAGQKHFGVWATTSRPQARVLKKDGKAAKNGGGWVQVSRLGNPLVNEVVIKMHDKDKFNATEPKDDVANYADYVVNPQLAFVLNALYGSNGGKAKGFIEDIAASNRTDLVAAFVTGVPGVNKHPKASATGGDMIRVNLDFPLQEWPLSGRQLKDDVVKSALTFLAQCKEFTANTGSPANPFGVHATSTVNCVLDDFVTASAATPGYDGAGNLGRFPYMDLPFSSYQN